MNKKDVKRHNKAIKIAYYAIIGEAEEIKGGLIEPCHWCKYDGEFRCDSCSEEFYEGFNVKKYPN